MPSDKEEESRFNSRLSPEPVFIATTLDCLSVENTKQFIPSFFQLLKLQVIF